MNGPSLTRRLILAGVAALASGAFASDAFAGERRIVAIGSAVTEILYRLGADGDIVGVDQTSQFPPEALRTKKDVGYVRALGAEGILSLRPTLIIASADARPLDVMALVAQSGVPIVNVPEDNSEAGIVRQIAEIADAVGVKEKGAALAAEVTAGFEKLTAARNKIAAKKRVMFVLSFQNGRPLVAGRGTTADAVIGLAGGANATAGLEGWKPLSDEGVISAAPDIVLTMSRSHGVSPSEEIFATAAFSATPAAATKAIHVMDAVYLLGFGPRTPQAAADLMSLLYGETAKPAP